MAISVFFILLQVWHPTSAEGGISKKNCFNLPGVACWSIYSILINAHLSVFTGLFTYSVFTLGLLLLVGASFSEFGE